MRVEGLLHIGPSVGDLDAPPDGRGWHFGFALESEREANGIRMGGIAAGTTRL